MVITHKNLSKLDKQNKQIDKLNKLVSDEVKNINYNASSLIYENKKK